MRAQTFRKNEYSPFKKGTTGLGIYTGTPNVFYYNNNNATFEYNIRAP